MPEYPENDTPEDIEDILEFGSIPEVDQALEQEAKQEEREMLCLALSVKLVTKSGKKPWRPAKKLRNI